MTVTGVKGSMISASSPCLGDKTRNSSQFKRLSDENYSPPNLAAPVENDNSSVEGGIDRSSDVIPLESQNAAISPDKNSRPKRTVKMPAKFQDYSLA